MRSEQLQQELAALDNAINHGQWDQARSRIAQLLEEWPDDVAVRHDAAVVAAHDHQWEQAQSLWEAILREQPTHVLALIGLGHVALHQTEWTVAAGYARQAMAVDSRYQTDARRILTIALAREIQDHLARQAWPLIPSPAQELLTLDPHHPVALTGLGMAAVAETPLQTAEAYFRQAVQFRDAAPNGFRAQMLYNLGDVLYRQQRYDEAVEWLDQAYQEYPEWESIRNGVVNGWTRVLEGALNRRAWDRVHQAAGRLLEVLPDDPVALNAMGLWYWHAHADGRRAFEAFRQVFDNTTSPRTSLTMRAQAAVNAGQIALARGRLFRARRWFLNARILDPRNSQAHQGLRAFRRNLAANSVVVALAGLLAVSVIFHG